VKPNVGRCWTSDDVKMGVVAKIEGTSLVLSFTGAIDQLFVEEVRSSLSSLDESIYIRVLFDVTGASSVDCEAWGEILSLTLQKVKAKRVS